MINFTISKPYIDENWEEVFNIIYEDWTILVEDTALYKGKDTEYLFYFIQIRAFIYYKYYRDTDKNNKNKKRSKR